MAAKNMMNLLTEAGVSKFKLVNQIKFNGFHRDYPHDDNVSLILDIAIDNGLDIKQVDFDKTYENYCSKLIDWINVRLGTNIEFNGFYNEPEERGDIFILIDPEESKKLSSTTLQRDYVGHYKLVENDKNMEEFRGVHNKFCKSQTIF